jgi:hypothetical protein
LIDVGIVKDDGTRLVCVESIPYQVATQFSTPLFQLVKTSDGDFIKVDENMTHQNSLPMFINWFYQLFKEPMPLEIQEEPGRNRFGILADALRTATYMGFTSGVNSLGNAIMGQLHGNCEALTVSDFDAMIKVLPRGHGLTWKILVKFTKDMAIERPTQASLDLNRHIRKNYDYLRSEINRARSTHDIVFANRLWRTNARGS